MSNDEVNQKLISDLLREVQPAIANAAAAAAQFQEKKKKLADEEVWGSSSIQSLPIPSQQSPSPVSAAIQSSSPSISALLQAGLHPIAYQSAATSSIPSSTTNRSRSRSRSPRGASNHNQPAGSHQAYQSNPPRGQWEQSHPSSGSPLRGIRENGNTGGISSANDSNSLKDEQSRVYLRLRGLPYNARERELFDFLGFTIDEQYLAFKHDSQGRFCGECAIQTIDSKQYELISQMHMRSMGKRYIEVFPLDKVDFIRARESQALDLNSSSGGGGGVSEADKDGSTFDPEFLQSVGIVKIRGLPYESMDSDITAFFKDSQIIPNGIQKVFDGRRQTGEAFILFASKADARKALEKDKQLMGSRYIETFLCHPKEYTNHIKQANSLGAYGGGGGGGASSYERPRYPERASDRYRSGGGGGGYQSSSYSRPFDASNQYSGGGYGGQQGGGRYNQSYQQQPSGGGSDGYYKRPFEGQRDQNSRGGYNRGKEDSRYGGGSGGYGGGNDSGSSSQLGGGYNRDAYSTGGYQQIDPQYYYAQPSQVGSAATGVTTSVVGSAVSQQQQYGYYAAAYAQDPAYSQYYAQAAADYSAGIKGGVTGQTAAISTTTAAGNAAAYYQQPKNDASNYQRQYQ